MNDRRLDALGALSVFCDYTIQRKAEMISSAACSPVSTEPSKQPWASIEVLH